MFSLSGTFFSALAAGLESALVSAPRNEIAGRAATAVATSSRRDRVGALIFITAEARKGSGIWPVGGPVWSRDDVADWPWVPSSNGIGSLWRSGAAVNLAAAA